jgi:hypothetical protein
LVTAPLFKLQNWSFETGFSSPANASVRAIAATFGMVEHIATIQFATGLTDGAALVTAGRVVVS